MKHNVGDRVRVHSLKWFEKNCEKINGVYNHKEGDKAFFIPNMKENCGKIVTIIGVLDGILYQVLEDFCSYEDWMFEEDEVKEETNWEHYQKEIEKFIANNSLCTKCPASKYCDTVHDGKCGEIFYRWANSKYVPEEPVAPQPVYRAWTKDTFPLHVGDEIKIKDDTATWGVVGYDRIREKVVVLAIQHSITFSELFANYEMSDGTPCGELINGEETK